MPATISTRGREAIRKDWPPGNAGLARTISQSTEKADPLSTLHERRNWRRLPWRSVKRPLQTRMTMAPICTAARAVDAAAEQSGEEQACRQEHDIGNARPRRHDEHGHGKEPGGCRAEPDQQHAAIAPAIGEQPPGQFAERNAQAEDAERDA